MSVASRKVPATVVTGIVSLMLGVGIGLVVAGGFGSRGTPAPDPDAAPDEGAAAKGGAPKGGAPKGVGGPRAPGSKAQLTQLVGKLDVLTREPLSVRLSPQEKQKVKEVLTGIEGPDALTEEDAKAKMDALHAALEGHKDTFVAAGYPWPAPFRIPGATPPNPYKAGPLSEDVKHLNSLRGTLEK
jgi:hypothetical protein